MAALKPSLDLLRSLTDEHVLRAVMRRGRETRAELAVDTGISKPTISQSVRRLGEAGLLVDSGERTTGRGRSGSYYTLSETVGSALVVNMAPQGIVAEAIDPYGGTIARASADVHRPARPSQVAKILRNVARQVTTPERRIRIAVVSAADPVDRATGRLVHLPDAPFLLGDLTPAQTLAPLLNGAAIVVDNDVNWAARAERESTQLDDFVYLYLGDGLGSAIVSDGEVRRGHAGLAGEIAHLITTGSTGRAVGLIEVFGELGLRRSGSTAIDVESLILVVSGTDHRADVVRAALAKAISGVLAAFVALSDPELVVMGGLWGSHPVIVDAIGREFDRHPRNVPIRAARVIDEPSLTGARSHALNELRTSIVSEAGQVDP